jgi:hypothetical protein
VTTELFGIRGLTIRPKVSTVTALIVPSETSWVGALDRAAGGLCGSPGSVQFNKQAGGAALSDIFGSWLIDQHHVSFFKLVWLNPGTTALILILIPFLPSILIDSSDGG